MSLLAESSSVAAPVADAAGEVIATNTSKTDEVANNQERKERVVSNENCKNVSAAAKDKEEDTYSKDGGDGETGKSDLKSFIIAA